MAHFGKELERGFRRTFIRSLRWVRSRGHGAAVTELPPCPAILLIRHDRIGDAIISTPVFMLLRERFPCARIDILLGHRNRSAAPLLPCIDNAITLPESPGGLLRTISEIRRNNYDIAINLLAKDSASGSLLTALSGAKLRIGFAGATESMYDIAVPKPSEPTHIVAETASLLASLGIDPPPGQPKRAEEYLRIEINEREFGAAREHAPFLFEPSQQPRIILNISGSSPEKFWGIENFVELVTRLREHDLEAVIAGSPGDSALVAEIAHRSGCPTIPPTPSLAEFAAMLSRADMILTPDTSIVHIAAALGKPTVMLVVSSDDVPWRPWGTPNVVVRHNRSIPQIPVDQVAQGIFTLATETIGPTQSSPRT